NSSGQGDGSFTGEAVWRPCEGAHLVGLSSGGARSPGTGGFNRVLVQSERGILRLEGATEMRAERRYLWRALGSEVMVQGAPVAADDETDLRRMGRGTDASGRGEAGAGIVAPSLTEAVAATGGQGAAWEEASPAPMAGAFATGAPSGPALAVHFDDGRPFHVLQTVWPQGPLGEALIEAVHHCSPDIYRVSYAFFSQEEEESESVPRAASAEQPQRGGLAHRQMRPDHGARPESATGPATAPATGPVAGPGGLAAFTSHWRITGPKKDLEIWTRFERQPDVPTDTTLRG
ncbi:MAG: DUF6314 family protein, partial [Pseudomonadota bacterium]